MILYLSRTVDVFILLIFTCILNLNNSLQCIKLIWLSVDFLEIFIVSIMFDNKYRMHLEYSGIFQIVVQYAAHMRNDNEI